MTASDAARIVAEASELLGRLSVEVDRPRYAMGERVAVAVEIAPPDETSAEHRIEIVCRAFGHVDANWAGCLAVLRDGSGMQYELQLDSLGHASLTRTLPREVVLSGVGIRSGGIKVLKAAAATEVGDLYVESIRNFASSDGRVRAKVHCAANGDLSVSFTASSEHSDLKGATVALRFFTDAGAELKGRTRLYPDDSAERQLAAIWSGNQMGLAPGGKPQVGASGKNVRLNFAFEVPGKGTEL